MKTRINEVTIAEPCLQNWDEMEKGEGFNFCKACSKNVIDFSGYTNAEIINVLANAGSSICGRLSQTQLNQLNYHLAIVPTNNRNWMKYLGVLAIGMSIFMMDARAENLKTPIEITRDINNKTDDKKPVVPKKIYGYVIGADNKPAAGIRLVIVNTDFFALTDKNGRYEITLGDKFDVSKNQLVVDSIQYAAFLTLDFSKEKQNKLKLKKAESMIMGKIMIAPKKK
ncbi:carboxypeptidase-like regulatory domain-containing protein [Pedobacter sp. R-06]|uniref:carboxypeptidase-like regulatory domain-containing protein n=1 Tax=Pedobacter sp. R-06 TaxID=3404051 RepID=UPI003CE80988